MVSQLKGMGVSKGKVQGRVRIVRSTAHKDFREGDILVTRLTDPSMIAMMNKAAGIICEIGGLTSHPSIVSRELGIPCIVAVKDATRILREGQIIAMDGTTGDIQIMKEDWKLKWR